MHSRLVAPCAPLGFRPDLPRWRQLVRADWLAQLLAQDAVPQQPAAGWQLFEVGCEGGALFQRGHIPGARYLDTQQFEQLPYWNLLPAEQLLPLLQQLGIHPATTVILYGRNTLAAARVALALLSLGVTDVRLLDGGLAAWCALGYRLQCGPAPCMPRSGPAPAPTLPFVCRSDYLLSLAQASALTQRPDAALVSIRSRAEWRGETSGYRYIAQRGEIAGALWGHAGHDGDVNSMASFQDATGCMRAAAEIQAMWAEAGIRPGMQIAFYCGTGWRAALAFFYAWLMGWPRISVFDGGWYEWSSDAANPVQNALPCPDRKAFPTPHHDPLPP